MVVAPYLSGLNTIIRWSQYHMVSVLKSGLTTILKV